MILEQIQRKFFARFRMRREPMSVPKSLFFMHIPKTAGTSLNFLLASRFPAEACIYRAHGQADQLRDVNQFQFISGHVGFEFMKRFRSKPIVVTFLRHPIDHALSNYFFHRSFRPEQLRDKFAKAGEDLSSSWVDRGVRCCEQVNRLSLRELLLNEPELAKPFFANMQTRYLAGFDYVEPRDLPMCARENLAQCDVVGLTERIEESLGLLCHELGWEPFAEIPRHNTTEKRLTVSELDDETRSALIQLLGPDLALYESAQQLFEQRLRVAVQSERPRDAVLPSATDFSFSQPFTGAGWYPRDQSGTTWACWSGPGAESWLEFRPTVASRSHFRCELLHRVSPQVLQSVQVRINDQLLTLAQREQHGRVILTGSVSPQALCSGRDRLRITFTVNNRWRPTDLDPTSNDVRWLGISVSRIQLTRA